MTIQWVPIELVLRFAKEVNFTREFTHLSKHRRLQIHNSVSGLKCNFLFSGSAPPSNTRDTGSSLNNTMSLASELPSEHFSMASLRSAPHCRPSPRLVFSLFVWVSHESLHSLVELRMPLHPLDRFCLLSCNWFPGIVKPMANLEAMGWVTAKMVCSDKKLADR